MLEFRNVNKSFDSIDGRKEVIKDFNIRILKGEFIALWGSNGTGKSTIFNLLTGDISLDSGDILVDNRSITNYAPHQRKNYIARVYQDPTLGTASNMTVLENLAIADNKGKIFGISSLVQRDRISYYRSLLGRLNLGLEEKLHIPVSQLSGGQRQALALIMITLKPPKILILDEHTSALDPKTSSIVMDMTMDIIKEHSITAIMICHNRDIVDRYSDRVIDLNKAV